MTVALGAAVSSCENQSFNEVEKTVKKYDLKSTTDDDELVKNKPGQTK